MERRYIDLERVLGQRVTLGIYHSNFSFTVVTKVKAWEVTLDPYGKGDHAQDESG